MNLSFLTISPDEKLQGSSPAVRGKFLAVSAVAFVILWPLAGVVSAGYAAPSISLIVLFCVEVLFGSSTVRADQVRRSFPVTLLGFVIGILMFLIPVLFGLIISFESEEFQTEPKGLALLLAVYGVGSFALELAVLSLRLLRSHLV